MTALVSEQLLPSYCIHTGSRLDRALLVKFMQLTYQELFPGQNFSHLAQTVEQYFSPETPLWWVDFIGKRQEARGEWQEEESTPSLLTPQRQFSQWGGSGSPLGIGGKGFLVEDFAF